MLHFKHYLNSHNKTLIFFNFTLPQPFQPSVQQMLLKCRISRLYQKNIQILVVRIIR